MTDPNSRDLIKRLADALHDAADDVRGWGDYASSYFQKKHDLRGNVARIYAEAAKAYAYLAQPEPEVPTDEELLFAFYEASLAEGGDTDEVTLRGLRAVLARWAARHNEGISSLLPCSARRSSAAPIVMAATSKP